MDGAHPAEVRVTYCWVNPDGTCGTSVEAINPCWPRHRGDHPQLPELSHKAEITTIHKPWSLFNKIETVNNRILNLQPPHFLDRKPDTLDKLVHWKASMFRAFLFHFAITVLYGLLHSDYFDHFVLFVSGVSLLNSSSVSRQDIQTASLLLSSFVENFEVLYGKRHMCHNVHMLLHLGESVQYLAPLWATSCFPFENMNGKLVQLVHGTRHAGLQISANLSMVTRLPLMIHNLENVDVKQYCKRLRYKWMQLKVSCKIGENIFCIGNFKPLSLTDHWMLAEISQVTLQPCLESIQVFHRLYKDGFIFVSINYRKSQRDSSFVKYDCRNSVELGNIVSFVRISETNTNHYAVIKRLESSLPFHSDVHPVRHLHEIHTPHVGIDVVPVTSLLTVLFNVEVSGVLYVSEPLNSFESE
ncbi:30S ribosomal protein S17 [Frankliniella fusca]|uniref:30S ribosomal protein S17 n=1 Tax=Frankliniella fusca TaxID=407009 RepID=A0AAE1L9N0_9NEOP|nr:30S ribosomal protein S17 [Frankliniella fusca]